MFSPFLQTDVSCGTFYQNRQDSGDNTAADDSVQC